MAETEKKAPTDNQITEADNKIDKMPKILQEPDTPGKIMVTGVPKVAGFTEADLEKEFAPYGRITEVNIIKDRRTDQPRGFAFITFENPQDAEDASKALEGKNLGGETPLHCEQAVIGLKRSMALVRGGARGNVIRGGDRGRGRGMDRGGRGRGTMERGGGRGAFERGGGRGAFERGGGRGVMERGGRGGMERGGRGMRGRPYPGRYGEMEEIHQDEYYEEYYEPEPAYDNYPARGGPALRRGPPRGGNFPGSEGPPVRGGPVRGRVGLRGAPPGRMMRGRGMQPVRMGPPSRGGPPRRALLPEPSLRGSRGGYGGPQRREEYYEEDGNGYQEEYYETQGNDPYAEEYEEQYTEAEDYYTREQPQAPSRGRGGALPQERRRPPPVDEYGYYDYQSANSQSQAPAQRRNPATGYVEEEYEEATPRMAAEQFERPRARGPPPSAAPVARIARGGAAPRGRGGMQQTADPYAVDESGMYETSARPPGGPAPGYEVESYGEATYGRRPPAGPPVPARPSPGNRAVRPALPPTDVYTTERPKPKPQPLMGEMVGQRRPAVDLMSTNAMPGREAYPEMRRPPLPPRRPEPEYREPYQMAAETDAYVSYPPVARAPAEMSRKRPVEAYEEEVQRAPRREFEEYRSAPAAVPIKRDRPDRNVYEAYSRQEGAYRGL